MIEAQLIGLLKININKINKINIKKVLNIKGININFQEAEILKIAI